MTGTKPNPYSDEAQHIRAEWNLTNHTPTTEAIASIEGIREHAKALSHFIIDACPPGPDRTLALRDVETATMMAVASIVRTDTTDEVPEILR